MDGKNVARAVSCEQFFLMCLAKEHWAFMMCFLSLPVVFQMSPPKQEQRLRLLGLGLWCLREQNRKQDTLLEQSQGFQFF